MTSSNSNGDLNSSDNGNATDVEGLALTSNLPDAVPDLLQTVAGHGKDLLAQDPEARPKLLEAARSLIYALETPREAIIRHCWSEVCQSHTTPCFRKPVKIIRADRYCILLVYELCGPRDCR